MWPTRHGSCLQSCLRDYYRRVEGRKVLEPLETNRAGSIKWGDCGARGEEEAEKEGWISQVDITEPSLFLASFVKIIFQIPPWTKHNNNGIAACVFIGPPVMVGHTYQRSLIRFVDSDPAITGAVSDLVPKPVTARSTRIVGKADTCTSATCGATLNSGPMTAMPS